MGYVIRHARRTKSSFITDKTRLNRKVARYSSNEVADRPWPDPGNVIKEEFIRMIHESPVISIFVPSIRPELWARMYNSLLTNKIPFEIIFIGPIVCQQKLPNNVRHIITSVKPSQCAEIGLRSCLGSYCIFTQDDIIFSTKALDILYENIRSEGDDIVISCIPYVNGKRFDIAYYRFFPVDSKDFIHRKDSPIVPLCGIYKLDSLKDLGGIDRNFVSSFWDVDLAMRFYEKGGRSKFSEEVAANEIVVPKAKRLGSEGKEDRTLLEALWTYTHEEFEKLSSKEREILEIAHCDRSIPCGIIVKKRRRQLEPFVEENITTLSQGPKGRWK
jgi:hypothetical protein